MSKIIENAYKAIAETMANLVAKHPQDIPPALCILTDKGNCHLVPVNARDENVSMDVYEKLTRYAMSIFAAKIKEKIIAAGFITESYMLTIEGISSDMTREEAKAKIQAERGEGRLENHPKRIEVMVMLLDTEMGMKQAIWPILRGQKTESGRKLDQSGTYDRLMEASYLEGRFVGLYDMAKLVQSAVGSEEPVCPPTIH